MALIRHTRVLSEPLQTPSFRPLIPVHRFPNHLACPAPTVSPGRSPGRSAFPTLRRVSRRRRCPRWFLHLPRYRRRSPRSTLLSRCSRPRCTRFGCQCRCRRCPFQYRCPLVVISSIVVSSCCFTPRFIRPTSISFHRCSPRNKGWFPGGVDADRLPCSVDAGWLPHVTVVAVRRLQLHPTGSAVSVALPLPIPTVVSLSSTLSPDRPWCPHRSLLLPLCPTTLLDAVACPDRLSPRSTVLLTRCWFVALLATFHVPRWTTLLRMRVDDDLLLGRVRFVPRDRLRSFRPVEPHDWNHVRLGASSTLVSSWEPCGSTADIFAFDDSVVIALSSHTRCSLVTRC